MDYLVGKFEPPRLASVVVPNISPRDDNTNLYGFRDI